MGVGGGIGVTETETARPAFFSDEDGRNVGCCEAVFISTTETEETRAWAPIVSAFCVLCSSSLGAVRSTVDVLRDEWFNGFTRMLWLNKAVVTLEPLACPWITIPALSVETKQWDKDCCCETDAQEFSSSLL